MGVVNASPESFSDGGRYRGVDAQVARAEELVTAGADIIDVGGESGVTGMDPLDPAVEIDRVVPLITRLAAAGITVSLDTWKVSVAVAGLEAGAALLNDVSGLADPGLVGAAGAHDAGLVVMHTRARPKHKEFPIDEDDDVVADVVAFFHDRLAEARGGGAREDGIIVDPGPDFGKTPAQTVQVLRRLGDLEQFGRPILLAVSRKDFIGVINQERPSRRLAGTLAAIAAGLDAGASILRVHDVAEVRAYLKVAAVLRGELDLAADARLAADLRREVEQ